MNWSDIGIVLSAKKHGEGSAIVSLMTPEHGRHAGLVRGGSGKRARGIYEAGNLVSVDWQARIEEHLGTFRCELLKPQAALYLDDSLRLAGLSSACAVLEMALPERESHPEIYESLFNFIANLESETWLEDYVHWEIDLLADLGFGLDLTSCASTGQSDELIYVSPKSGQAVSTTAGEPYKDKLLALPGFLQEAVETPAKIDFEAIFQGLNLTSYFMDRNVFIHSKNGAPPARTRLVDRVKQKHTLSGN
ncbi:MAG: DNA repair protein RecO [Rhodospirillaceae bacterium]|jgi:DNA repair protein RecO (recombination protein O)|nr:DNA repair protein RecO [Rhodospirillaceae bacterium]MBT4587908.1 DNA repair protein RecO [Rhodospirillaceae bacterium]MBT4939774.1 DNA repair protein RecO [Rhodospirillaceae bacterium]MBT5939188.1 DNA repair protein RecO [Rhodospirillaceae bacterium]MBT7268700.1 DNA repair protein RecO [Rhodospirillaceae bacterium]